MTDAEIQALHLRDSGLSRKRIAATLNLTPQAVKKRFWRARKRVLKAIPEPLRGKYRLPTYGPATAITPMQLSCAVNL